MKMTKTTKMHKTGVSRRQEKRVKQSRRRIWGWIAAGVIVLVLAGFGVALVQASQANISGIQTYSGLTAQHTTAPVHYAQNPPVGGDHNPVWLNCGIYDQSVPNENAVHSLEHGAVWVTYQPTLPAAAVDQLRQLVRGRTFVILSPYDNLPAPVVASAWGVQLFLTGADDARLPRFLNKYIQGPQTPELGALCTGGMGNPLP
jgi:hypothetical protein